MSNTGGIRRMLQTVGEMNYAVRRLTELRLRRDLGCGAPLTYSEFLPRGSACLVHEPSARERAAGQRVG